MRKIVIVVGALCALVGGFAGARAEEPKRPWTDSAEFSLVTTSGNTKLTTFSLANKFVYAWPKADLTVEAGALFSETTSRGLTNPGGFVVETSSKDTTAEMYTVGGKYRRDITDRFLWYGLASWYRNEPTGIQDRTRVGAGVGYKFFQTDAHKLVGELGIDYTDETQVGPPEVSDSFAGARGFLGYERKLSDAAKYNLELEMLENLDETSDYRANFLASVTASLTQKMALKASYRVMYDNLPVVQLVPGPNSPLDDALFEFDKTDAALSVSLVINF